MLNIIAQGPQIKLKWVGPSCRGHNAGIRYIQLSEWRKVLSASDIGRLSHMRRSNNGRNRGESAGFRKSHKSPTYSTGHKAWSKVVWAAVLITRAWQNGLRAAHFGDTVLLVPKQNRQKSTNCFQTCCKSHLQTLALLLKLWIANAMHTSSLLINYLFDCINPDWQTTNLFTCF